MIEIICSVNTNNLLFVINDPKYGLQEVVCTLVNIFMNILYNTLFHINETIISNLILLFVTVAIYFFH
jgi:hypothetical protein